MENQQKINLFRVRDFSENFDMILTFLKQNYGAILKGICYIMPIMLIVVFLLLPMQGLQNNISSLSEISAIFLSAQAIAAMFIYMLVGFAVSIYPVCYMVIYSESENGVVEIKDVWNKVKDVFLPLVVCNILFGIAITIGVILCLIPGIVLAVYCIFFQYVYIAEGESITGCFSRSWNLVRDNWWVTFLFGVIMAILMFVIGVILSLPQSLGSIGAVFGSEFFFSDVYIYITTLVSYVGQLLIAPISTIAIGVLYYSRRTDVDKIEFKDEINSIGSPENGQHTY